MYYHALNCIKMNIVLDLRAIYGHFAGTPFIQPRLASVNKAVSLRVGLLAAGEGLRGAERVPGGEARRLCCFVVLICRWEERFCTPPPSGGNFRDRKCPRIETKACIHHPLWVVVVHRIGLPSQVLCCALGVCAAPRM